MTSAITMAEMAEPFIRRRAIRHLEKGRVVICAAGTGNPFFTTDSAAALRASELKCEIIFKATKVDGIYTADPEKDPTATRIPHVTYQRVLADRLQVMLGAFHETPKLLDQFLKMLNSSKYETHYALSGSAN